MKSKLPKPAVPKRLKKIQTGITKFFKKPEPLPSSVSKPSTSNDTRNLPQDQPSTSNDTRNLPQDQPSTSKDTKNLPQDQPQHFSKNESEE